jgi:hypothetical protein
LGIYLLLILSGDIEEGGWNRFLYGGSIEDEGNNYGVNNFISTTTWRLFFSHGNIKAEMMSPPCLFVVVRSVHDEEPERISFRSVFLILRWQKEEGRHEKEEDF